MAVWQNVNMRKTYNSKTKTTLRIDTYLKGLADEKAKKEGIKLQYIVNEALKAYLKPNESDKSWVKELGSFKMGIKYPLSRKNLYKTDAEITGQ